MVIMTDIKWRKIDMKALLAALTLATSMGSQAKAQSFHDQVMALNSAQLHVYDLCMETAYAANKSARDCLTEATASRAGIPPLPVGYVLDGSPAQAASLGDAWTNVAIAFGFLFLVLFLTLIMRRAHQGQAVDKRIALENKLYDELDGTLAVMSKQGGSWPATADAIKQGVEMEFGRTVKTSSGGAEAAKALWKLIKFAVTGFALFIAVLAGLDHSLDPITRIFWLVLVAGFLVWKFLLPRREPPQALVSDKR
jgi:hypothetical protein